jgi:hypothetical protein
MGTAGATAIPKKVAAHESGDSVSVARVAFDSVMDVCAPPAMVDLGREKRGPRPETQKQIPVNSSVALMPAWKSSPKERPRRSTVMETSSGCA